MVRSYGMSQGPLHALLALAACLPASPAFAHAGERGQVLLLPTELYITGGAVVVAFSFIVLALTGRRLSAPSAQWTLNIGRIPFWFPIVTSLASFVFMVVLVLAGLIGNPDPLSNPLPVVVWTLWWVGFTLLTALTGNLWKLFNPWSGFYRLFLDPKASPLFTYPRGLGSWPALLLFFAFAWFELVYPTPLDPARLAMVVIVYVLVIFCGMVIFGPVWLQRGEVFAIFFRLVSTIAPAEWIAKQRNGSYDVKLRLGWPASRLTQGPAITSSETAFLLLALSTVSFDGLSRTFAWNGWLGLNPLAFPGRSALLLHNTLGLLLCFMVLSTACLAAFRLGDKLVGRRSDPTMLRLQLLSFLPIAIGFHFAHYFPNLLLDWKHMLRTMSDPFARGWNILGTTGLRPSSSMALDHATITLIYVLQTMVIVLAHVAAVFSTHRLALSAPFRSKTLISQVPVTLFMIAYTIFGLWLLSTPVIG